MTIGDHWGHLFLFVVAVHTLIVYEERTRVISSTDEIKVRRGLNIEVRKKCGG